MATTSCRVGRSLRPLHGEPRLRVTSSPSPSSEASVVHRPCLDCGRRTNNGSRCAACDAARDRMRDKTRGTRQQRGYGAAYMRERERVLSTAVACYICGGAATRDDPLTADHVVPLSKGGGIVGNLRPAHLSCNSRRGDRA